MRPYLFTNEREIRVEKFHEAFNVDIQSKATEDLMRLRLKLIREEFLELQDIMSIIIYKLSKGSEIAKAEWIETLDGMADLQVVLSGTAVAVKELRNFAEAFFRVHESNMSKLGEDGKPILREDGKVLKGPNYKPPVLDDLV